jgi:hypothetical protein
MDRDDIIRMAREAGFTPQRDERLFVDMLERFASLVYARGFAAGMKNEEQITREEVAAEREACAAICDTTPPYPFRPSIEAAHAIRARGQHEQR